MKKTTLTLLTLLALGLASSASAAELFWQGPRDGSTLWTTGTGDTNETWATTSSGSVYQNWADGDTASLHGGAGFIELGSDISASKVLFNFFGTPFDFNLGGFNLTLDGSGNNVQYNTDSGTFLNGTLVFGSANQFSIGNGASNSGITLALNTAISGGTFALTKVGSATLSLGAANVFGDTFINEGTLLVQSGSSLGSGNITLNNTSSALTLESATAIADDATLTLSNSSNILNLDFVGTEAVGFMNILTNSVDAGTYTATELNDLGFGGSFSGTGSIQVIPEPSSIVLVTLGLLGIIGLRNKNR